jgi:hypothetical protein
VLLVAVQTPSVSQELMMFKGSILKKVCTVAYPLEFKPRDIIFNQKLWYEFMDQPEKEEESIHVFVKKPTDSELDGVQVPENVIEQIKDSIASQNFSTSEMKQCMMQMILKDIKVQIWRKNNGFPVCENCGITLNVYRKGEKNLCPSCKFNH